MLSRLALYIAPVFALFLALGATISSDAEGQTTSIGISGGSTGTTGGVIDEGTHVYITDITEAKSASTHGYFSGSWQTVSGKHVVGVQYNIVSWDDPDPLPPHVTKRQHFESIFVEQGTEMEPVGGATFVTDTAPGPVSVRGFYSDTLAGNFVRIQTSDADDIETGRRLTYWVRTAVHIEYDNAPPYDNVTWAKKDWELVKLECGDASIDTRKTYGQPNTEGELPADANAPLRHVNFGPWHWKGGLFVGNMPAGGKDASGTSRIQFYPVDGDEHEPDYIFASLSLFDMGKPSLSGLTGAVPVGVYIPEDDDPHISDTTESDLTWATRWTIDPEEFDVNSTDFDVHPVSHRTLTNGNTDDYVSFALTKIDGTKPDMALRAIVLAIEDEETYTGNTMWHYFTSKEHKAGGSSFPRTDSQPRVWLIKPW